jgi:hypothetical protein
MNKLGPRIMADEIRQKTTLLHNVFCEVRGNAFWDAIKAAGWGMSAALVTLIHWLQRSSKTFVAIVLFIFWAVSLVSYYLLEIRRSKRRKSGLVLPQGFDHAPRNLPAKLIIAGMVFAIVFSGAGILFSVWFKEQTILPIITVQTLDGLPLNVPQNPHLRLSRLMVRNETDVEIANLISRVQLPEPIYDSVETNCPPGTSVEWSPIIEPITVSGIGSKSIIGPASVVYHPIPHVGFFPSGAQGELFKSSKEGDLTGVWELTVDKLPRKRSVSVLFLTYNGTNATNYLELVNTEFKTNGAQITAAIQGTTSGAVIIHNLSFTATLNNNRDYHFGTNALRFSVEGQFQYQFEGKPRDQHFLVPISFESMERRISSKGIQTGDGHWRRIIVEFQ